MTRSDREILDSISKQIDRDLDARCEFNSNGHLISLDLSKLLYKFIFPVIVARIRDKWVQESENLDLYSEQLQTLFADIVELRNLTILNLSNNNLTEIPDVISQLTNLTNLISLDLSDNRLKKLPAEVFQLTKLLELNLSKNELSELSSEIGQLNSLTWLDLRNNQLSQLPLEIGQLTHLTQLYLGGNPFVLPYSAMVGSSLRVIRDLFDMYVNRQGTIERMIEFAPEHKQAGISILNYFSEVINQKYPDMDAKINIQQDGLTVRMIIEPPEGEIEIIEETLEEYGLVVTGKKSIEEFLDDPMDIIALQNKLEMAMMELKQNARMFQIKDDQIASLQQDKQMWHNLAMALSTREITIKNELNTGNISAQTHSDGDIIVGDKTTSTPSTPDEG